MNIGDAPITERRKIDHDADIKEKVMISMALPWKMRPLYSTKAQDTTPTRNRKERRVKRVRRIYWHLQEDLGIITVVFAIFGLAVLLWFAFAGVLSWMR